VVSAGERCPVNWLLLIPFAVVPLLLAGGAYWAFVSSRRATGRAQDALGTAASHLGMQEGRTGVYLGNTYGRPFSLRLAAGAPHRGGPLWQFALATELTDVAGLGDGYAHGHDQTGTDFEAIFARTSRNTQALTRAQRVALVAFVKRHKRVFVDRAAAGYRVQCFVRLDADLAHIPEVQQDLAKLCDTLEARDEAPAGA
jgi:hypothetical protein